MLVVYVQQCTVVTQLLTVTVYSTQLPGEHRVATNRYELEPLNPYLTNGFSLLYHLGQSTFIFRGVRSDFSILFNFSIKIL